MKIGFIDYRPDRGHAGNFLTRIRRRPAEHAHEVVGCWALEEAPAIEWCKEFGVKHCTHVEELQGRVDGVMIPASSDPEHHSRLLSEALKIGVPIFVDKPFATDAHIARQMFEAADAAGVPVFSSSALRFCDEVGAANLEFAAPDICHVFSGWCENFDEFVIHPVELLLSLVKSSPISVSRIESRGNHLITTRFADQSVGLITFTKGKQPYEFSVSEDSRRENYKITSAFFENLLDAFFSLVKDGTSPVAPSQTLAVLKVIDASRQSVAGREILIN